VLGAEVTGIQLPAQSARYMSCRHRVSRVQSSGNVAPLPGVGDKALRGTSSFTKVVAAKGRSVCSIELAGVGNVASEAELVTQSQEIREQKLGSICAKLFAAKKL
jgi:hypothetical protein